jgi:cytochrome aa3-600 menaquinol oxidase subunit II
MGGGKWLRRIQFGVLAMLASVMLAGCGSEYVVLNPKGPVAQTQYELILLSVLLVAIIFVPVVGLTAFIVYRYRDKPNSKASYKPNWDHSTTLEVIWWSIPVVIIAILGYFTVRDIYALKESPNKEVEPITIQVTALEWKWMFTYPEQDIATVNHLKIPAGVPVKFLVSADGPMNSFWVPSLGGQIYAMGGMATELYLQADEPGVFNGFGANFTGEGFAHMQFDVTATTQEEFDQWVTEVKASESALTKEGYDELRKQGLSETLTYSAFPEGLFEEIVAKYSHGHPSVVGGNNVGSFSDQHSGESSSHMPNTMTPAMNH